MSRPTFFETRGSEFTLKLSMSISRAQTRVKATATLRSHPSLAGSTARRDLFHRSQDLHPRNRSARQRRLEFFAPNAFFRGMGRRPHPPKLALYIIDRPVLLFPYPDTEMSDADIPLV